MTYCACGRKVFILPHPGRNPRSWKGRAVNPKQHDQCRQCWKSAIYRERQGQVSA